MVGSVPQSSHDPRTLITNRLSPAFNSLSTVLELVWTSMRMVEQGPITDGIATDCGVCVIAMLTDLPHQKVLADIPHYRAASNHDWMRYLNLLSF
jgi:hypothetical protein